MNTAPQPLYAQLRDHLRAAILGGRLRAHDKLPSESGLALQHGVSRITVRQALGALQNEGLITRLQGKGAYVSPPHTTQNLARLEGLSEALAPQGQVVHSRRLSMKRVKAPTDIARELALEPDRLAYQLLTLRYVNRRPASVNRSYYPPSLGERMVRLDLSGRDVIQVLEQDLGLEVATAHVGIAALAMPAREARWLQADTGEPALQVRRVLLDSAQRPLQTELALHRADTFHYQLTVSRHARS